jgi:hypothetical protein
MSALGRQRPEVPLHAVEAQARVGQALLGVMKPWNFDGSRTKKTDVLLPTMSKLPSSVLKLQREAARVAHGVGEALLTGHGREAGEDIGLLPTCERNEALVNGVTSPVTSKNPCAP